HKTCNRSVILIRILFISTILVLWSVAPSLGEVGKREAVKREQCNVSERDVGELYKKMYKAG
ncbi:MAG: hypothetical protein ACRCVL_07730, partial [Cetobacterium sp.]